MTNTNPNLRAIGKDIAHGLHRDGAEMIILIPGLGQPATSLEPMAKFLHDRYGYTTLVLDEPNRSKTIEKSAKDSLKHIKQYDLSRFSKVHAIGASRGGLTWRKIFELEVFANMGRFIMLGTPNGGSHNANFFHDHKNPLIRLYSRKSRGPSLKQLRVGKDGIQKLFNKHAAPKGIETGIIAGTWDENHHKNESRFAYPRYPKKLPMPEPHDGTVHLECTKLKGSDHITLEGTSHTELEVDLDAIRHIVSFFREGKFSPLLRVNGKKQLLPRPIPKKPKRKRKELKRLFS